MFHWQVIVVDNDLWCWWSIVDNIDTIDDGDGSLSLTLIDDIYDTLLLMMVDDIVIVIGVAVIYDVVGPLWLLWASGGTLISF